MVCEKVGYSAAAVGAVLITFSLVPFGVGAAIAIGGLVLAQAG